MPPIYDFGCPKCEELTTRIINYAEYEELETVECDHCKQKLTKKDRRIGFVRGKVNGIRKGFYNSFGPK